MVGQTTSRQFADDRDLAAIKRFLSTVCADLRPTYHWHLGNLLWSMYHTTAVNRYRDLRLWEDESGTILGFAWFDEPNMVDFQTTPELHAGGGEDATVEEMLAWGANRAAEFPSSDQPKKLVTWASDADTHLISYLSRRGFARDELALVHLCRGLEQDIPEPTLAEGWQVRHVADHREFDQRVELHRSVWAPSRSTVQGYENLRAAPGYRPELDLVVVAPDGTFASYCICWFDPVSRSGVFEPVGTRPDLQGRGLGRIVMLEGLRRIRVLGGTLAIVTTNAPNSRAIRLYEGVGFREINRDHQYSKKL
jgi:mycothiol synthase